MAGRFAPSPTGDLHVGNLRTALVAWLSARAAGERFLVRMEDLDPVTSSTQHESRQLDDLAALGIDHDGDVLRQSGRFERYHDVIAALEAQGRTYPCFCSRREIREAASAPHGLAADGAYPGTCRDLSDVASARRGRERRPALRLRGDHAPHTIDDEVAGPYTGVPDDFVLRRADGVPAYNLAVVVDDADQGVTQVVRGDDLLPSTPRHVALQLVLGAPQPRYRHVPMVVGPTGERLAKRDGAVTLADLSAVAVGAHAVRNALAMSLGIVEHGAHVDVVDLGHLVARFAVIAPLSLGGQPVALSDLQRLWDAATSRR